MRRISSASLLCIGALVLTAAVGGAAAKLQKFKMDLGHSYVLGAPDAPIVMVEFTDLECPDCRRFHAQVFPQIKQEFIDTGKVRFVSRDWPLEEIHPHAWEAALYARCAGEQGKFWEMRDLLLTTAPLGKEAFHKAAESLSLNAEQLRPCVEKGKFKKAVREDALDARYLSLEGTPAFVIGRPTKDGLEAYKVEGVQPFESFAAQFNELMAAR